MTFVLFTTRSALFCTMMAMALLGENISATRVSGFKFIRIR